MDMFSYVFILVFINNLVENAKLLLVSLNHDNISYLQ